MTHNQWWEAAGAIGTFLLAVVAVWGEPLRAYFVGPRLRLHLLDARGERQQTATGGWVRYYHLQVTNKRRFAPAKNVRIVLTGIARPDANEEFKWKPLSGALQLRWQRGDYLPQFLTVGPPQNADLGNVLPRGAFSLSLIFLPLGFQPNLFGMQNRMIIEAKALSDETESPPIRVKIAWDGQWSDDTAEMAHHMVLEELVGEG